ncbi:hypothetical protein ACFYPC_11455 [Streptomyces sp. NPDC005808]|uniref:hypothetical protein n=1 Tax=Streptomyces sp. NPDC005808 TaxID=3364734 RepID=UPI0036A40881
MAESTRSQTIMTGPVHLPEPTPPPQPVPGCGVCSALDRQRAEHTATGDPSKATDCNVEIRNHPHPARKGRRA